jgi:RIO kinase 1
VAAAVFQQAFIPRKLDEVTHYERDHDRLAAGQSEGIYYQV